MMGNWSEDSLKELIQKSRSFEPRILSMRVRTALSVLNYKYPVYNTDYIYRDYRGLAYYLGWRDRVYMEMLDNCSDPVDALLTSWMDNGCPSTQHNSVAVLLESLVKLERFDVLEDVQTLIEDDIAYELQCTRRLQLQPPIQSNQVSSSETPVPQFAAFVCYAEEDIAFVKIMIEILERRNGCKLFIPDRDLHGGASYHTITAEVIEKQCLRMIVVLSSSFKRSPACDFQVKFAHCLEPGSHSKRMIPVLFEKGFNRNDIPPVLRHVTLCDYTKSDTQKWFWNRLTESVREPHEFTISHMSPEVTKMNNRRNNVMARHFSDSSRVISSSPSSVVHFRSNPSLSDSGLASMQTTTPPGADYGINPQEGASNSFTSPWRDSNSPAVHHQSAPVNAVRQRRFFARFRRFLVSSKH